MTRAYDKFFLPGVMNNLGFAVDFAVNGCSVEPDSFYDFFIASKVAKQIEEGSPVFICGSSGTELALAVFDRVGFRSDAAEKEFIRFDRSPEYWAGWVLAYYQWNSGISFSKIRDYIAFHDVINMYYPLHEAPKEKFSDLMNDLIQKKKQERGTNLHRIRKAAGLTQKELAELSGVNLRTLQQYEIGLKDINRASGAAINALALALRCNFYDVMELNLEN